MYMLLSLLRLSEYATEIEENRPEMMFIVAVTATSQSSIIYEIIHGNDDNAFIINPSSGVIKSNDVFDYERRQFYNLTVRARNVVNVDATVSVLVHVIDLNDNAPAFSELAYSGFISEDASPGSVVLDVDSAPLVIRAHDVDSDRNSLLTYSIVDDDEARNRFEIDASTGALKIRTSLDHEQASVYSFQVQVHDSGSPRRHAATLATVAVYVADVNDSPPIFEQSTYDVTVLLPTYADVLVVKTTATDADSSANGQLTYSIAAGNSGQQFRVDAKTGALVIHEPANMLDRYDLVVKVTDGVFENSCSVVVNVDLLQDTGLEFTQAEYTANVVENSTAIENITVVQARGHDVNEHVTFAILNPDKLFQIGATSGVIRSTGIPFDREKQVRFNTLIYQLCEYTYRLEYYYCMCVYENTYC